MGDLEDLKLRSLSYILRGGEVPDLSGLDSASLEELENAVWWVPLTNAEKLRHGWPEDKVEALEDIRKMLGRTIRLLRRIERAKVKSQRNAEVIP